VFAQWIQFTLTIDGCALLSKTSAEVLETLKHQLETFQLVKVRIFQRFSIQSGDCYLVVRGSDLRMFAPEVRPNKLRKSPDAL